MRLSRRLRVYSYFLIINLQKFYKFNIVYISSYIQILNSNIFFNIFKFFKIIFFSFQIFYFKVLFQTPLFSFFLTLFSVSHGESMLCISKNIPQQIKLAAKSSLIIFKLFGSFFLQTRRFVPHPVWHNFKAFSSFLVFISPKIPFFAYGKSFK
ncbi:unnamed protein product [Meloidogyne enterolobii]|uniref:Uncharacterized protein n=1 Tax=Meloidogyne enterolobii TaxID=390850 RepID=A0ACB0XTW4_MELEN